jgi:hypothetical protein
LFNSDLTTSSKTVSANEAVTLYFKSTYESNYLKFYNKPYFDIKKAGMYRITGRFGSINSGTYLLTLKDASNTTSYVSIKGSYLVPIDIIVKLNIGSFILVLTPTAAGTWYSDSTVSRVIFEYLGEIVD